MNNIDKNIVIPSSGWKYNFGKMEVGDSIFFENQDSSGNAYNAAKRFGVRKNMKFSLRKVENGCRIWRIK